MTVIGAEAIGNAPVQSVTDLFKAVPGINTVRTSARDVNVTTRAATGTLADSMLVLLDGRSVYQDFFAFVLWDFLPVDTTEIKQIEVIRGPASAVWGANAMTGVVNVITKTPREMQGTNVSIRFGQFDRSRTGERFEGGGLLSVNATHAAATERSVRLQGVGGRADPGAVPAAGRQRAGHLDPVSRPSRTAEPVSPGSTHASTTTCPTPTRNWSSPAVFRGPRGSFTADWVRSTSCGARRSSTAASATPAARPRCRPSSTRSTPRRRCCCWRDSMGSP